MEAASSCQRRTKKRSGLQDLPSAHQLLLANKDQAIRLLRHALRDSWLYLDVRKTSGLQQGREVGWFVKPFDVLIHFGFEKRPITEKFQLAPYMKEAPVVGVAWQRTEEDGGSIRTVDAFSRPVPSILPRLRRQSHIEDQYSPGDEIRIEPAQDALGDGSVVEMPKGTIRNQNIAVLSGQTKLFYLLLIECGVPPLLAALGTTRLQHVR